MQKEKKSKLMIILWGLIYLGAVAVIIFSSVSLFNNFYYESIYVSGPSMNPTFIGDSNNCDYGTIDKSQGAKSAIKRYQIVTTYYPHDNNSYKIKRIIFLPGETFKVVDNDLYLYKDNEHWSKLAVPYDRILSTTYPRNYPATTLKDNEYFVSGDNYMNSSDSFNVGPIESSLLVGVLTKMEGKCTIKDGKVVEKRPEEPRYFLGVDY